jgi:hypothetical protein
VSKLGGQFRIPSPERYGDRTYFEWQESVNPYTSNQNCTRAVLSWVGHPTVIRESTIGLLRVQCFTATCSANLYTHAVCETPSFYT